MKFPLLVLSFVLGVTLPAAPAGPAPIVIAIAGDSTVSEYPANVGQRGWGQFIQPAFDDGVIVKNLAKSGRSTKTFLREGLWAKVLATKPSIVLIQFGHNDSHSPDHPEHTDPEGEYTAILQRFVDEARAAGATPILITPVQRRTATDTLIPYAKAMTQVALRKHVGLIDLHRTSGELYARLGPAGAGALAKDSMDKTHFNAAGARAMAQLVLADLVPLVPELHAHLRAKSTLYICGDSTAAKDGPPLLGWGEAIRDFLDPDRLFVVNAAAAGRSARTFIAEGRWEAVRAHLTPKDFVVLQFGHNDSKSALSMGRYDLPGLGAETETITDPKTGQPVILHTFGFYLRTMIDEAKQTGAAVIVLSSVPRNKRDQDGRIVLGEEGHVGWAAELAKAEDVPYFDANDAIARVYDQIPPARLKARFFPKDNTHTNPAGARLVAACIAKGLARLGNPALTADLSGPATANPDQVISGDLASGAGGS